MSIDSINELWDRICEDCRVNSRISDVGMSVWIVGLVPISMDNGTFTLTANNEFKKKTIDMYYKKFLEDAAEAVFGLPMKVEITVVSEPTETKAVSSQCEDSYTFDNFVVGSSNKFAHAAAIAVAEKPSSNMYNPLFIYGNSGVGKTHLMLAIKNSIKKNFPDKVVLFLRGEQFTNELIQALRNQTTDIFHEKFRTVDVLLLDDIHFIAGKETAQEEFFNTFNALYPEKQIVVTSDRPPKEIKTLELRIRSRFESGMIADMSPPDFETRIGILKNKADQLGLTLNDDIIFYIAEQIKSNIRQLEGIVKRLHAHLMVHSDNITFPLVQRCINDVVNEDVPDPVTVDRIVAEVSRSYNVSVDDIYSRKKSSDIAYARQIAIYIVSKMMDMSSTKIGEKFGKDHSTVLYTINTMKEKLKVNESERQLVEDICKNIKS